MSGGTGKIGSISEDKEKKRTRSLSLSRGNSMKSNGGDRPSSRASSSASGLLTREEVSSICSYTGLDQEEERGEALGDFCHNIFDICDTDNDGFITINELLSHCDDTFLMNTLIEALGADQDDDGGCGPDDGGCGSEVKLSFEEFRVGLERVSELLLRDELEESTPDRNKKDNSSGSTVISDHYINGTVTVYESDEVCNEEAWQKAMSRIDPYGHLSKNEELKTMWTELSIHDQSLLERFEVFLSIVVSDLDKSQSDVETIQSKIRKDDEDDDDDDEAIDRRRELMRERAKQRNQEEVLGTDGPPEEDEEEIIKKEESEESSEYEDYSDSDTEQDLRLKPVFVRKTDRVTIKDERALEQEDKKKEKERKLMEEKRKKESNRLLQQAITEDLQQEQGVDRLEEVVNTDNEEDEEEYEAWKIRELQRIKRDREELEQQRKEREDMERVRNMSEEQRLSWLKSNPKTVTNSQVKGKYKFLQKYYHRGVFYLDEEDEVFKRNFCEPTLEDHFDKSILPQVMQVKNFGMAGRTKYTHLVDQDTTTLDNPWSEVTPINLKFQSKGGGVSDTFHKPTRKKQRTE